MRGLSVALVIGGLASPAAAADGDMWGIGGQLGTMAFPGAYPALWPSRINNYDVDGDGETEVGPAGNEQSTTLEKVRGDFLIGAQGYYWIDRAARVGGYANYDSGTGFSNAELVLKYDQRIVGAAQDTFGIYVGGGLGFGSTTFKGLDANGEVDTSETAEKLVINHFPARVELTPFIKLNNEWALQPKLWGGLNIPSGHRWSVDGEEVADPVQGTLFNYIAIGIDFGVMYGDFKPAKVNKGKKGGGKKGKK
jgi:hypothetical protein